MDIIHSAKEVRIRVSGQNSERPAQPIRHAFKHLTWCLRLLGILFISRDNTDNTHKLSQERTCMETYTKFMHALGSVMVWTNFCRFFLAYTSLDTFNVDLMLKLVVHVYIFKCAVSLSTCFKLSRVWFKVFTKWHEYRVEHSVTDTVINQTSKRVRISLWISVALLLGINLLIILLIIIADERHVSRLFRIYLEPLPQYITVYKSMEILASFLNATSTTVLVFPMGLILCICLALRDEFEDFNRHFRNAIKSNVNPENPYLAPSNLFNIEYYRRWHQDIINILELFDDALNIYIFVMFVCDVPMICGFLYAVVFTAKHTFLNVIVGYIPGVAFVSISLVAIIVVGTKLNIAATNAKFILYAFHLDEMEVTPSTTLQYSTFLNRLCEGHIGITGWKLFHINKMTIKVVGLMIVSYTLILLKFNPVDNTSHSCSETTASPYTLENSTAF